jgi:hypothetical protein
MQLRITQMQKSTHRKGFFGWGGDTKKKRPESRHGVHPIALFPARKTKGGCFGEDSLASGAQIVWKTE